MKLSEDICKVKGCNNHVMEGRFGLESFRYGYCQIHKIEGTWEETTPTTSTMNNTHNLTNPALDAVSRIDGCENPQDCSRQASGAEKEDTSVEALPADSKFTYKCICDWSKDDEYGFIPNTGCPVHGKQTKKMLSKGVPI